MNFVVCDVLTNNILYIIDQYVVENFETAEIVHCIHQLFLRSNILSITLSRRALLCENLHIMFVHTRPTPLTVCISLKLQPHNSVYYSTREGKNKLLLLYSKTHDNGRLEQCGQSYSTYIV